MNVLKNTNKTKKFILVIVFLILFNFCCPVKSNANDIIQRIEYSAVELVYLIENGVLTLLNNIFCDKSKQTEGTIYISPENIIKGKFVLMDSNIFKKVEKCDGDYYDTGAIVDGDESDGEFGSSILKGRNELRNTISGWYYALRNLALVALLSILVYVGIRMLLTSVSQDKAKYKMMLKDWFVALCLLFAMHYIMIATLNLCSTVTKAIGASGQNVNMTEKTMNTINENMTEAWNKIVRIYK